MAIGDFFKRKEKGQPKDINTSTSKETKREEEEKKIVSKVQRMYKESYNAKGKLHEKWKKNYEAYTGELFEENKPDYRSNEVSNYVFATIETIKPIMLNDNPKTQVVPRQGSLYEKARTIQNVLDSEWKRTKMFPKLHLINHLNLIYGTAITGLFWNGKAKNGLGDIEPVVISPFNIFPEPSATDVDNAEYIIYATYKKASILCKEYPDKAEEIKKNTTTEVDTNLMYDNGDGEKGQNNVLYIECYMRDYSQDTYIEEEEDGSKYKVKKMKYPNGRRIIIAGDVLLEDGENPYSDGSFPYRALRCYPQFGSFWGISEVEMLVSPQVHQNKIMNGIIDNAMLNGNPWTILDKNSGVERNSLSNAPGLVIRKNPGTEVRREAPPPLPAYIVNVTEMLRKDMEYVSGMYDVVRGERPGSITAASAIQALNEQAQGRIKLKVQVLEDFIGELGALWVRRVQQFWVTQRTVRVTGNIIMPETTAENIIQMQGQDGKIMSFLDVSKDELDGDYDIDVFAGSTMQTNKSAIAQTVIQLAQTQAEDGLPMLDRKTVLENVIDTVGQININEVLEYFQGMAQSQQEGQMQQQESMNQIEMQKMEHESQLQQMEQQHEMGMQNMEHASKMQIEQAKGDMTSEREAVKMKNANENNSKALQSSDKEVQYNGKGEEELAKLIEYLLELPQEQYDAILKDNPELADYVQAMLQRMEEE